MTVDAATQLRDDVRRVDTLSNKHSLNWYDREALKNVLRELKRLQEEKSWESPYRKAISVLEAADRSFAGGFG